MGIIGFDPHLSPKSKMCVSWILKTLQGGHVTVHLFFCIFALFPSSFNKGWKRKNANPLGACSSSYMPPFPATI